MRLRPCEGTSRGCCERMMSIERRSNSATSIGRQWRACQEDAFTHLKCYRRGIVHSNDNVTEGTVPGEEKMTVDERRKYVARMRRRYQAADRKGQGALLDEMEKFTGMHRKSLIRLLSAPDLSRKARRKQRGRKYGPEVDDSIRVVAESLDYICAERLKPALPDMEI